MEQPFSFLSFYINIDDYYFEISLVQYSLYNF